MRIALPATVLAVATVLTVPVPASAERPTTLIETPMFADLVAAGTLPSVAERLPVTPLMVTFEDTDREAGRHGGSLDILMGRAKDVRQMVVYGYARLVGYNRKFELVPDLLENIAVEKDRVFTLTLREGHKWSDGQPFTAEDFRYYWEDMVTNTEFSPAGPPQPLIVDGERARFEVIDARTVRYTWSNPNHFFLPALAGASPLFIYRPAHYLKRFHARYADPKVLADAVKKNKQRNWVALHFRHDRSYKNDNPDMPSLQPWINTTPPPADRFKFARNPYFHRIDGNGRQLPYIDRVNMLITNAKLIPPKSGAGESDLQSRGLGFSNYTYLKRGEKRSDYAVYLWRSAKGSQMALFPNLSVEDPAWRKLVRTADFRRALSLAIDRHEINQVIYFGLAIEGNNTVLPESPLYKPDYATKWARYDLARANRMLDGLGLAKRDGRGVRLLPDGRPMEIVVETAGEDSEQIDVLELIHDSWLKAGIKIYTKPLQREVFRNRVFAGSTIVSVWFGLENGVPTAGSSPQELAPTSQQQLQWPKWGQYRQTAGKAGEPVDMPVPKRLFQLEQEWRRAGEDSEKRRIWHEMLSLHADNVFTIGLIAGVRQPIVVDKRLRNVPKDAIYNWDPGAHFGIYRPDQFWFDGKDK